MSKAPVEKTLHEELMEGFEKEQKEREAEEQLERSQAKRKRRKRSIRRSCSKAKEEEVDYNKVEEQIKTH